MSQEQVETKVETKLVEQTESIVELVKKINETLRESKISELCKKLYAYGRALDAIVNKKHYMFELQFSVVGYNEYRVQLHVDNEYVGTVYVPLNTTVDAMFEKIFNNQELRERLVSEIYETIAELAEEIASRANLVERVREIEKRLVEEDP